MNLLRRSLVLTYVLLAASCGSDSAPANTPAPSLETRRTLDQGAIIGFNARNGAHVWRAIPYAAPPVGDLRWRAPRPPHRWTGERVAIDQPAWCPQVTNKLDKLYGIEDGVLSGSEDCLYLNIYAPSKAAPDDGWPVMLWVHGGSNVWGRAELYDGSVLAERFNVVVVVIQYRLGPLGWFAHPLLRDDAKTELDQSANFATLDIIASLKWVQGNIGAFGGDPEAVTIFGESAGGLNILSLLTSPLAEGLFRGAIIQSGMPGSYTLAQAQQGSSRAPIGSLHAVREWLGDEAPEADELRQISVAKVFDSFRNENGAIRAPAVIADGVVIPESGVATTLKTQGPVSSIPVILGSNRDEAKYIYAFDKRFVRRLFGFLPLLKDPEFYDAITEYQSRMWRAISIDGIAVPMSYLHDAPVYIYRFDWDEEGRFIFADLGRQLGAAHSLEVPFVFGVFDGFLGKLGNVIFTKRNADGRQALSDKMMSYWAEFAYSGRPGSGREASLSFWASIQSAQESMALVFDTSEDRGTRMAQIDESIEEIFEDIDADARLDSDRKRCIAQQDLMRVFGDLESSINQYIDEKCKHNK